MSTMKRWRSFTIAYCMCHFITLTPVSINVLGALRDPASILPSVEANNFVDPTMVTAAALTETGLILAALIPTYLFIWRSWLSATAKHTTLSGDSSSGSVENFTDAYNLHRVVQEWQQAWQPGAARSCARPFCIYIICRCKQRSLEIILVALVPTYLIYSCPKVCVSVLTPTWCCSTSRKL